MVNLVLSLKLLDKGDTIMKYGFVRTGQFLCLFFLFFLVACSNASTPVRGNANQSLTDGSEVVSGGGGTANGSGVINGGGDSNSTEVSNEPETKFDYSGIIVNITSKKPGDKSDESVIQPGLGNKTTITHSFYGIDGSNIKFSLSQKLKNEGYTMKIDGNSITEFDQSEGEKTYTIQIYSGDTLVTSAQFVITSKMRPVEVKFTGIRYKFGNSTKKAKISMTNFKIGDTLIASRVDETMEYKGYTIGWLNLTFPEISIKPTNGQISISTDSAIVEIDTIKNKVSNTSFKLTKMWDEGWIDWGSYFELCYTISQQ